MEKEGLQTLAHLSLGFSTLSSSSQSRTPVNIAQLEVARLGKERQVEKEGLQTLAHLLTLPS